MKIPLNGFDEHIDETILKRGLSYFRNGKVHEPLETGPGEFETIVDGTEAYTVRLVVANGVVTEHVCSCPYDMGPVCKHVAAVLFSLRQEELGLKKKPAHAKTAGTKKTAKRKTVVERVDALLDSVAIDDLKQFVREQASMNVQFRNLLLASLACHDGDETKGDYAKQLKLILRSAKDRDGFIGWSESNRVGDAVGRLLDLGKSLIEGHNYKSALLLFTAVMEQMVDALQYSDDSNGSIGGCIEYAYEMIWAIADSHPSGDLRTIMLDYCLKAVEKKIYSGWDWHAGMLRISVLLVETEEEAGCISRLLDQELRSEFVRERAQDIKYELIAKTQGESAAESYLEANLVNPGLRRMALQKAVERQQFEKAKRIALDGVEYDRKKSPGLALDWYDWLLNVAFAEEDRKLIVQYARLLFIDNIRQERDYYVILKQYVAPEQWISFVEALIRDIAAKGRWQANDQIGGIFISEGWWARLLENLSKSPDMHTIAQYETHLSKDYSAELIELYGRAVIDYLKNNVGRSHYQQACRYLRRMLKLGGKLRVNEIITFLRSEYRSRKALMEELDKV